MTRFKHIASTSVALVSAAMMGFATPSFAENTMTKVEFVQNQKGQEILASNLIGEDVVNFQNETIGDINDLVLNDEYKTGAIVIGVGGFLGLAEKDVAVPLSDLKITRAEDGYRIEVAATKAILEAAPEYKTVDDMKGGVTKKIQKKMSEAGETIKDAAKKTTEKAKETYSDVKKSMTDETPKK